MRRAIALLLAAVALAQEGEDAQARVQAHCVRGDALASEGKLDEARGEFVKARALCLEARQAPAAAAVLSRIADILLEKQAHADAADAWKRYVEEQRALHVGDHPDVARGLERLAKCLGILSRPAEALPLCEESLAMYRRLFEGDHPEVAAGLHNLASCLTALGRVALALPIFEESLAMYRRLHAGDDPTVARCLGHLGTCLLDLGRAAEALRYADEALAMRRRLFEGDDRELPQHLNVVAGCLMEVGRPAEALPLQEEALAMTRRLFGGDHPDVTQGLNNLASSLLALGRAAEALPLLEESLAMRRRLFPGDHLAVATGLNNLAGCLERIGRVGDALPLAEESLAMYQRLFEGDHPIVAKSLRNVAGSLTYLGRPGEALPLLEESLAMKRRLFEGDHPDVALGLADLAICLEDLGRVPEALPLTEQSLAMYQRLFEGDHPEVAAALNNVGILLRHLGRNEEALPRFEESLAMCKRVFEGDHPDVVRGLNNVAVCLGGLGRAAEALPRLQESLAMCRRLFGDEHPDVALGLKSLAQCLEFLGRSGEALPLLEEAAAMARRSDDARAYMCTTALARARLARKETEAAASLLQEAIDQIEGLRGRALGLTESDRGLYFERLKQLGMYDLMVHAQRELGRDGEALRFIERSRARSLLDLLDRSRLDPVAEVRAQALERGDRDLVAQIDEVNALLRDVDAEVGRLTHALAVLRPTGGEADERRAAIRGRVADLAAAREARGKVLRRRAQLIRSQIRVAMPADASALQRLAGPEGRVLVYSSSAKGTTLFVVPPAGTSIRAMDLVWPDGKQVTAESVAAKVEDHARGIGQARGGARGVAAREERPGSWDAGRALFRALVPGAAWDDVRKAKIVYVVADGALQRLAFESLPVDEEAKQFWIDAGPPVVYGPSGSALLWSREQGDRQRSERRLDEVVVLGAAVFSGVGAAPPPRGDFVLMRESAKLSDALSRYGELVPLPGTRREAEAIAKAFGPPEPPPIKVTLLLGEDATAPNLRRAAPRARYLHIATHGLADETEFASYSSLALTLPKTPTAEDDGFLSLADVLAGWRGALTRCELVVLSACETQRGFEQRDEGVYALPVGFLYAGAPSVIASLWRVDDASTAELFGDFYGRLREGKGKLEAFTEARRALKKKHPEPYFWAPFVYVGDPR